MDIPFKRLASIDVFRALTMFFMIFVNDLDPIPGVPEWIKHVGEHTDGLGFADTIFPAFLFIVGLSIPLALGNRIKRGAPTDKIAGYVLLRGLALLVMGFFQVNLESYDRTGAILPKALWEIAVTVSFFAIWLDFPKGMTKNRRLAIQGAGMLMLAVMAFLYKGTEGSLGPHWWGILGLIGWSYLLCAGVYLFGKGRLDVQIAAGVFFLLFNIAAHAHWLESLKDIHAYVWVVGNGSMPTLTMGGVIVAILYTRAGSPTRGFLRASVLAAALLIGLGFALRQLGGISKVHDTPAWVLICMGISVAAFAFLAWLVDKQGKESWFRFFKPAGTSTLTCYLVPYLLYSLYMLCGFKFPLFLSEGTGGLIKSLLTAALVIWLTGLLERARLRLKI
jgi:predicted acyltransferase